MLRTLRMVLVLLLAASVLVVIPGAGDATVPGAVGRILFVSDADHVAGEIYIRDFAGSSPIRLTTNTAYDLGPMMSPDGTYIVFGRDSDVWTMNTDGSGEVNLTNDGAVSDIPLDWSPDGTEILFLSDRDGDRDLWVMYADGSQPRQVLNTTTSELDAAWSPDGSTIAFSRLDGLGSDIWLVNANGTRERRITNNATVENGGPAWSPDGTKLAYQSGVHPNHQIWIMGSDGSNPAQLAPAPGTGNWGPEWAPDGSRIAFTSNRDGDMDVWMVNPDGTGLAHLTDNPANERNVSWESVNRMPNAIDDTASVVRGRSVEISVLGNDSDPDGESLIVSDITTMPTEGSVVINSSGTVTYTHSGTAIPSGRPTDTFVYEVEDTRLGWDKATVTVWINPGFDDVPESNTFFDDITWLAAQEITRGCNPPANTLFCPTDLVTRGQMAAFLVRALHYTAGAGANLFVDDNGSTFELDIDRLGTAQVTRGCNPPVNDRFCPDSLVTRGQMAAFIARAFKLTSLGQVDLFVDDNGSIFEGDIDKLGATGVSRGCNPPANDRFCPDEYVTRQQMAAFIHRAVNYIL